MRRARTSTIFALPCFVSVTIPACEPVRETARWPRSLIAIAASAQEMRSPTEMSMSSSRASGRAETWCASEISSSVVAPMAERTATTRLPSSCACTSRLATRRSRSGPATLVPPNFITTVPRCGRSSTAISGIDLEIADDGHISLRPDSARPSVTSSAYSRSLPTGSPLASRVTRTRPRRRSAR